MDYLRNQLAKLGSRTETKGSLENLTLKDYMKNDPLTQFLTECSKQLDGRISSLCVEIDRGTLKIKGVDNLDYVTDLHVIVTPSFTKDTCSVSFHGESGWDGFFIIAPFGKINQDELTPRMLADKIVGLFDHDQDVVDLRNEYSSRVESNFIAKEM